MKIDLVICCGDFQVIKIFFYLKINQSVRNLHDMHNLACPDKYLEMNDFHKYYSGELIAPYLTIFIGGNHEA